MFDMFLKDPNFLIDVFHNMRDGLMLLDIDGNIVYFPESLIGETTAMQEVRRFIAQVSNTDFPVLISGESGAGKGAAAWAIHFSGKRRNGMFFSVHCGAFERDRLDAELFGNGRADDKKKGLFGEAGEATIVLEDIDETDPLIQAKIAALLEKRRFKENGGKSEIPFGGMVIATTTADIRKLVREGRFRQDLFFRLSMFWMRIPALRERKDDIPLLADHFLSHYKAEFGRVNLQLGRDAVDILSKHHWPGNVRELKGLIGKGCLLEEVDTVLHEYCQAALELTIPVEQASPLFDSELSLFDVEKKMIEEALRKANGNMTVAAKALNISYYTLRYRMKKFGIKSEKQCQAAKQAKIFDSLKIRPGIRTAKKTRPLNS